jgi:hypothetical protein
MYRVPPTGFKCTKSRTVNWLIEQAKDLNNFKTMNVMKVMGSLYQPWTEKDVRSFAQTICEKRIDLDVSRLINRECRRTSIADSKFERLLLWW